jgi:DeoR/GlpR family transcriptional regulator of sugar metabolism
VLLADHTKLGRVALHRLAPLRDFDLVLTDNKASDQALAEMRELGVRHEVVA